MADAGDSKSPGPQGREGSTPSSGTTWKKPSHGAEGLAELKKTERDDVSAPSGRNPGNEIRVRNACAGRNAGFFATGCLLCHGL
jgi:hypothetical protein